MISYQYKKSTSVSAKATVSVIENKTEVKVKDSTIYVGDKWQAKDNLVRATDKDGENIDIKDIDVKGSVRTKKAGTNKVTYMILNRDGKNQ